MSAGAQVALTASLFDLSLEVMKGEVIRGVIQYSADLFSGETAARMAGHFKVSRHCRCSRTEPKTSGLLLSGIRFALELL